MKRLLMGNEAIALGALHAGVRLVSGYPGTPSTETLEAIAREKPEGVYVEWSVNEKAALEVAAGAAYAGARTLVTMKQVGLNVASDPLMSLAYIGVKGGMVVLVADDPGPISSQTEQDTRHFAQYAHVPVFDPASPEEAYAMVGDAFALSEKYQTPVILRPTTRVCHGCAVVEVEDAAPAQSGDGFVKEDSRWVIFPRTSYQNHIKVFEREAPLADELCGYRFNTLEGEGPVGIVCGGVSYAYVREALDRLRPDVPYRLLRIATPYPFPKGLVLRFLQGLGEALVVEELDPVLEDELTRLCGQNALPAIIHGKRDGRMPPAGENTALAAARARALRRLSAPRLLLCGQARHARTARRLLRRHRLLYPGQCGAAFHGGYMPVHGRGHHDCPGPCARGAGQKAFCLCGGFHVLPYRHSRSGQRGL